MWDLETIIRMNNDPEFRKRLFAGHRVETHQPKPKDKKKPESLPLREKKVS